MSEPLPKNAPVPIMRSMEASPFRNIAAIRVSSAPPIPTNIPAHSPKVWMKCENTGMATKSSCAVAAAYTFSRRFHQIWKPSQETKAITSQTRINAAIIRPPPYRNRSLLMAITSSMMGVSRLRIARIAYSQRKGSRKNLPVSIYLSTGSKNEKNLLSFIRIEDFKVNTSQ